MVYINDQGYDFEQIRSLADWLLRVNVASEKGIAVALNNNVISREKWEELSIKDNDKILIIKATQGG